MATDIVQSLFGVTPEMYQRQQDALLDKQALQFAQLDPFERANYGIFRGTSQLGGALGRALGGEDPELARISLRQQVAREIDPTSLESIQAGIQRLAPVDPQGAMMLTQELRKAQESGALVAQRRAERMTPEQRNALAYAATKGEPGTDAYKAAFLEKFEELTTKNIDKKTPEQRNAEAWAATKGQPGTPEYATAFQSKFEELIAKKPTANIQVVGVAQGTNKPVYLDALSSEQFVFETDAQGKQIRQPYVGGVDRTASKVSVSVAEKGNTAFIEELAKLDAKRVNEALTLRENAITALNTFDALSKLDDQGLISGTLASGRVGATNLLNTLGLISGGDVAKLARSENYQKVAGDAILATLGGKLGAGFSNEDRKFIQSLVPQLENSAPARRQLIEFMQRKNRNIVEETTRLETYARDKLGLKGYVPSIPLPSPTAAGGGALQGLTDEELKRRYEEAKKAKEKK